MVNLTKHNTILNLSKLNESELDEIFSLLDSKFVCKGLQWKLDNRKVYLERMKTFKKFNNVYLYIWPYGEEQYTTEVYYKPNVRELIDYQTFKEIHFNTKN